MWSIHLASSSWLGYETVSFFAGRYFDSLQIAAFGVIFAFPAYTFISDVISSFFGFCSLAGYLLTIVFCSLSFMLFTFRKQKNIFFYLSSLQWWTYLTFGFLGFTLAHTTQMAGYNVSRNIPNFFEDISSIHLILCRKVQQSNVELPLNQTHYITNFLIASIMGLGESTIENALFFLSFLCYLSLLVALYSLFYFITNDHLSSSISVIFFYNLNGAYFSRPNWICPLYLFDRSTLLSLSLSIWAFLLYLISFKNKDIKSLVFAAFVHGLCSSLSFDSFFSLFFFILIFLLIKKISLCFTLVFLSESISVVLALYFFGFVNINNIFSEITFKVFIEIWQCFGLFGAVCFFFGLFSLSNEQLIYYLPSILIFLFKNSVFYYTVWIPVSSSVVSLFLTYLYRKKQSKFAKIFSVLFSILFILHTCSPTMCRYVDFLVNAKGELFNINDYKLAIWALENTSPSSVFGRNVDMLYDPLQMVACKNVRTISDIYNIKDSNITHFISYNKTNALKPNQKGWKLIYSASPITIHRRL